MEHRHIFFAKISIYFKKYSRKKGLSEKNRKNPLYCLDI